MDSGIWCASMESKGARNSYAVERLWTCGIDSALLCVRQITVEDLLKKNKMELRLLHGVAYGQSWFGKWGYKFHRGSFGVKEHNYETSIDLLSSLALDRVVQDFSLTKEGFYLRKMIQLCGDLCRFMLTEKPSTPISVEIRSSPKERVFVSTRFGRCSSKSPSKIPSELAAALKNLPFRKERPTKCRKFSNLAAKMDSRWPVRRLEQVAEVIVEALKEKRAAKSAGTSSLMR